MNTPTQVPQDGGADVLGESLGSDLATGAPENGAEVTRSERNILEWIAYLPRSCVKAMIRMGWDKTT